MAVDDQKASWRWAVVLSASLLYLLIDGVRFSFGILYVEFLAEFGASKGDTAWVGSLLFGVSNLAGTLSGALVKRLDCRLTIILGSVLAAAGLGLSSVATSVQQLYVTFGLLQGVGTCCMLMAAMVSITRYFDTRRALAFGIAVCGGGLGSFLFGPLVTRLIADHGWRGTVLIEAAIVLHGVAIGLIHRPIDTFGRSEDTVDNRPRDCTDHSGEDVAFLEMAAHTDENELVEGAGLMDEKPVLNGRVENLSSEEKGFRKCSLHGSNKKMQAKPKLITTVIRVLETIFPYKVLQNTDIFIFVLASFIRSLAFYIPPSYLPDLALEQGFSKTRAAWLPATQGIVASVSRVVIGWLADFPRANRLLLYVGALTGSGIVTCLCPLFKTFESLVVYAIIFGIQAGAISFLCLVLAADLAGADSETDCMAALFIFFGTGALVGTPIAGWLFDLRGSYDMAFVFAGAILVLSGAVQFIVYLRRVCRRSSDTRN